MRRPAALALVALLAVASAALARGNGETPARAPRVEPRSSAVWIGATRRGVLGVQLIELSEGLRLHYGAPADRGVMVSRVEPGSPADREGITVGDVLLTIDGTPVTSSWALRTALADRGEGEQVRLTFLREGRRQERRVSLEVRSAQIADLAPFVGHDRQGRLVLLDPTGARRLVRDLGDGTALPPPEELERALEAAVRSLRDPRLPARVRAEIEEKRRLEERIRQLERRLAEVEDELARRDRRSPRHPED